MYLKYSDLIIEGVLDGLNKGRRMVGEILECHNATLALNKFDDGFGDAALVKAVLTVLGHLAERLAEIRQSHELPRERRFSIQQHLVSIGRRVLDELVRALIRKTIDLRYREAAT